MHNSVYVLTAAEPDALLPTILSRVVRVRVARHACSIVAAFVQRELGVTGQRAVAQRVAAAEGSIGRVLAEGERQDRGGEAAERFAAAVKAGPVGRYAFALGQQPFQARGGFTEMLDGLLERLREQARSGEETGRAVRAIAQGLEARTPAQGNLNPQPGAAVRGSDLGTAGRSSRMGRKPAGPALGTWAS